METRLLREFLILSKQLNFSRAAEQLNMTQPVLSRHIKYLEEHFEAQFLKRNTHKVELTAVGKLFAEEAQKILLQYEASLSVIRASSGTGRRSLSIVFLGEATRTFLSSFLGWFSARHADITIECSDSELDAVPSALDRHTCDLAFIVRPNKGNSHDTLQHFPLFTDPLCIAVNKNHPLARRSVVSIHEVGKWPIISVNRQVSPLAWECSFNFLESHGVDFTRAKESSNLQSSCFALEFDECGVVLLPKHRRYLLGENSMLIDVAEEDCLFNVELVCHPNNVNPSREVFLKELIEFSGERHGDGGGTRPAEFARGPYAVLPMSERSEAMVAVAR
jgi:DNA-binding transcriptional LysR family regulator